MIPNIIAELKPYILYNNSNGTQTNFTLTDNASNYKYLDFVIGVDVKRLITQRVYILNSQQKTDVMGYCYKGAVGNGVWLETVNLELNQKSVSFNDYQRIDLSTSGIKITSAVDMYSPMIYEVIGYK